MNPYTINPPESEVEFEKLCLALLKRHWSRPGLERFAKKGEEQFGVDIFDTLGESPLYAAVLDSIKAQSEAVSKLREIYKSTPVTLHMYGDRLGHTAYEGLFDLAVSENDFVRCAPPQMEVLAIALATLGSKSTIVLDLTALATLRLLGITRQVLTSTAFRFVISPATFTELQQLRAESRFSVAHGTMYYEKGQHYITEMTEEQSEKQKAAFEDFMQCVEKNTNVVPVPQLATFTSERRELLERILGRHGLESALLSLSPGYIWWADDYAAAEIAKSELGVELVWTQVVLEHIANLGLVDRGAIDDAYAKLISFDYQSTHFTGAVMVAAVSNGSVNAFPLRQMICAFGSVPLSNRNASFRLLAEFILRLSLEPLLPQNQVRCDEGIPECISHGCNDNDTAGVVSLAVCSSHDPRPFGPTGFHQVLRSMEQREVDVEPACEAFLIVTVDLPHDGICHTHLDDLSPPLGGRLRRFRLVDVHHRRPRQPVLPPLVELQVMPLGDLGAVVRQQQRNIVRDAMA